MKYLKKYKPFLDLITENKTEAIRKKYVPLLSDKFGIDIQKANTLFDDLSEIDDLTTNKVYLQWVLNNAIKTFNSFNEVDHFIDEDFYKWKEYLKIFQKVKDKLDQDKKNIQSLSVKQLTDIALQFKDKEKEIGTKNEVLDKKYKITENEEYLVYWFKDPTPEDFKFYQLVSTNTEWCTRPDYETFQEHVKDSPLIIFINKMDRNKKYQLHGDSLQFMNQYDQGIDQQLAKSLIDIIYDYLPEDFVTKVQMEGSYEDYEVYSIMNKMGEITLKGLTNITPFENGFATFTFEDDYSVGAINKKGELVLKGLKSIKYFSEGLAEVKFLDDTNGFINDKMEIVLKGFKSTSPFVDGLAAVQFKDNSWGYIDYNGKKVFGGFKEASSFKKGFAAVRFKDNTAGLINKKGETVIKGFKYFYNFSPYDGFASGRFADERILHVDIKGNLYDIDYSQNITTPVDKDDPRLKEIEFYPEKFIQ
jgi:hypothetical protein